MCYIGNASSLLALAAYLCGKEDVANYYVSDKPMYVLVKDETVQLSTHTLLQLSTHTL